jgi:hypothetical protein
MDALYSLLIIVLVWVFVFLSGIPSSSWAIMGISKKWNSFLDFCERPFVLLIAGIVGGIVGTFFYRWVLAICCLCVLLAFHKHGVVRGKPIWRIQVPSYLALLAASALFSYWLADRLDHATKKYIDEMATAISEKLKPFLIKEPQGAKKEPSSAESPSANKKAAPKSAEKRESPVFSVTEEFPILSPGGNDLGTKFWLRTPTPSGCTISQAQAALYIRIKNLRPYPVTVVSYSIEAIEPLIRIPTPNRSILGIHKPGMTFYGATKAGQVIPVTQGSGLAAMSETPFNGLDFSRAKLLEMDSLDEQIAKPIAPSISIRGWVFFEYPVDQFGYVSVLYKNLIMKIKTDPEGSFSYWLKMEPGDPNGDVLPRDIKIKDVIDVSGCERKRYELPR